MLSAHCEKHVFYLFSSTATVFFRMSLLLLHACVVGDNGSSLAITGAMPVLKLSVVTVPIMAPIAGSQPSPSRRQHHCRHHHHHHHCHQQQQQQQPIPRNLAFPWRDGLAYTEVSPTTPNYRDPLDRPGGSVSSSTREDRETTVLW